MDKSTRLQLEDFFKQFTKLSERVDKYWPDTEAPEKPKEDEEGNYEYKLIKTKEDLNSSELQPFVNDFFKNIYKYDCLFSPRFQDFSSQKVREIKNRIQKKIDLGIERKKNIVELNKQTKQEKISTQAVYTFLLFACPIIVEENQEYTKEKNTRKSQVSGGLIINYYLYSQSLFIESILVDSDIDEDEQKIIVKNLLSYKIKEKQKSADKSTENLTIKYSKLVELVRDLNIISDGQTLVKGIYHEAHDPVLINTSNEQEKAADVLDFFHDIDAKHIRFAYKRPIISEFLESNTQDHNYFLLTFPSLIPYNTNPLMVKVEEVMAFIIDYGYDLVTEDVYKFYTLDKEKLTNDPNSWERELSGFSSKDYNPIKLNAYSLKNHRYSDYSNDLYLNNVPRLERPKFLYKRAAVCFEIIVDEDYFYPEGISFEDDVRPPSKYTLNNFGKFIETLKEEWNLGEDPKPIVRNCIVTHSTETDLFAYKYQSNPPYFTKYFNLPNGNDVTIKLPSHFEFTSEGRQETYYVLPNKKERPDKNINSFMAFTRELEMEVHLSYTYFLPSNVRIWHMVLTPREQKDEKITDKNINENDDIPKFDGISELDIIKLMKFFSGSQENESEDKKRSMLKNISFSYNLSNHTFLNSIPSRKELAARWLAKFLLFLWNLPIRIIKLPFKILRLVKRAVLSFFRSFIYKKTKSYSNTQDSKISISKQLFKTFRKIWASILYMLYIKEFNDINYSNKSSLMNDSNKQDYLISLLQDLTGIKYKFNQGRKSDTLMKEEDRVLSLRNIRSGIVEIDTGAFDEAEEDNLLAFQTKNFEEFWNKNREELKDQSLEDVKKSIRSEVKKSYLKLYNKEKDDSAAGVLLASEDDDSNPVKEYANYVFKAYCGICLGIFDYDRMGLEEIDDTLMPLDESKTDQSFQALNRGVLSMFGYEEDVMNTFWKTLGLSPYLIVPSAVLAHNDYVSLDAEKRLDALLARLRNNESDLSIQELISNRHEIDDLLNDDILSNVFHYKTEQGIYRQGMQSRGIDERIKASREKLGQLDKEIELKQEERSSRYQQRIQIIVTILGLINFYTIIRDFFVDELADPKSSSDKSEKVGRTIHWSNVKPDKWVIEIIDSKYFPSWSKDFLINIWHRVKGADQINAIGLANKTDQINAISLSHMTFFIIVTGAIIWLIVTRVIDPSKSGKSKSWQNRKKRRHKLPKVQVAKPTR
ncbi:hypothetical protein GCM10028808_17180 [Spirosoma migulaei]